MIKMNNHLFDQRRYDWINRLKAIGIGMVLLGHTPGISKLVDAYIFSFHMPLFFFLAGLVLTEFRLKQSWKETLTHYTRRLLLPYFLFSMLAYVPWVFVTRHYGAEAPLNTPAWKPLVGTLYGVGVEGWLQHNPMLWFFPCLFVVHMGFRLLWLRHSATWLIMGVLGGSLLGLILASVISWRLPWGIQIALIALPFYACGYALSAMSIAPQYLPRRNIKTALISLGLLVVQCVCIAINGRVDMNFLSLGHPFLFYLGAIAGIGALAALVTFLPAWRLWTNVAEASILAFPLHRVIYSGFTAIGLLLLQDMQAFKLNPWGSLSYAAGAIVVSVILLPWARRFAPVLIGGR